MKAKTILIEITVLLGSVGVALGLCELGARLFLRPADFLSVEMVRDPVLGVVPSKSTIGHGFDEWGFRNPAVPNAADIVAIGDSHTYGNTARMDDSWPYVLGRLTGRTVYNMALGGYGPNQYFYLLTTRGVSLKPRIVICGLYMGDDFDNAYLITYGLDHWAYLRRLPGVKVDVNTWDADPVLTGTKKIRNWFSRHSVLYQLIVHGPILGWANGEVQIRNAPRTDTAATALIVPEKHIEEAFRPKEMLRRLDQQSASVQEGMRLTFELLRQMNEICRSRNVKFMVAVIPTKELVFSDYLEHRSDLPLSEVLDSLLVNERAALDTTFQFLKASNISNVDTLPNLRQAIDQHLYAASSGDMHPSKNGYRVIGEAISNALQKDGGVALTRDLHDRLYIPSDKP